MFKVFQQVSYETGVYTRTSETVFFLIFWQFLGVPQGGSTPKKVDFQVTPSYSSSLEEFKAVEGKLYKCIILIYLKSGIFG